VYALAGGPAKTGRVPFRYLYRVDKLGLFHLAGRDSERLRLFSYPANLHSAWLN